jgi:putative phosphoesterase
MITLGILSDTHIPDRRRLLRPGLIPFFQKAGVSAILHAGDVCAPWVLSQLEQVAPVYAVRGNRDWVLLSHLPLSLSLEFAGLQIGLIHGHGRFWRYVKDKGRGMVEGANPERYLKRALAAFPEASVVIFGHTHMPINTWVDGKLAFNPGCACCPGMKHPYPTVGLLHLSDEGKIVGEIIALT